MSAREVWTPRISVIACLAEPDALDGMAWPPGAVALRVAPDEANVWCAADARERVLGVVAEVAEVADPTSLVLDVSAGWTARLLLGPDAPAAFASLTLHDPGETLPGLVQGAVRGVPARSLLGPDFALVLVTSIAADVFDCHLPGDWLLAGEPVEDGVLERLLADAAPAA